MTRHNKAYSIAIGVLGLLSVAGVLVLFLVTIPAQESRGLPSASNLRIVGLVYSVMTALIVLTLVLRTFAPRAGRVATKCLHVLIMYFYFPVGTVVGLYGFWRVDRVKTKPTESSAEGEELTTG